MDSSCVSSSLSVELKFIRARNIFLHTSKPVFVRCYFPTQSNKRVKINSQEIPSTNYSTWNQTFSLNCVGSEEAIQSMKQGVIVFELRCRSSAPFSGSKLLARAEMAWNNVVGQPDMKIEKWVVMIRRNKYAYVDDVKPPAMEIAVKVDEVKKVSGRRSCDNCGCMDCRGNVCVDYDFFALEDALEVF